MFVKPQITLRQGRRHVDHGTRSPAPAGPRRTFTGCTVTRPLHRRLDHLRIRRRRRVQRWRWQHAGSNVTPTADHGRQSRRHNSDHQPGRGPDDLRRSPRTRFFINDVGGGGTGRPRRSPARARRGRDHLHRLHRTCRRRRRPARRSRRRYAVPHGHRDDRRLHQDRAGQCRRCLDRRDAADPELRDFGHPARTAACNPTPERDRPASARARQRAPAGACRRCSVDDSTNCVPSAGRTCSSTRAKALQRDADPGTIATGLQLGGVMSYVQIDAKNLAKWFRGQAPYNLGTGAPPARTSARRLHGLFLRSAQQQERGGRGNGGVRLGGLRQSWRRQRRAEQRLRPAGRRRQRERRVRDVRGDAQLRRRAQLTSAGATGRAIRRRR